MAGSLQAMRFDKPGNSSQNCLMGIMVRPLQDQFGAEIGGVDIAQPLDAATFAAIEAAWTRHGILLFRGVRMTPGQHIAFTRRFGPLHIMEPRQYNLPGHPEEIGRAHV